MSDSVNKSFPATLTCPGGSGILTKPHYGRMAGRCPALNVVTNCLVEDVMNKRRTTTLAILAAALLWAVPAAADYPADCNGTQQPSAADCNGLSYEGCCDDQGRVTWCGQGQLFCIDCPAANSTCGWKEAGIYDCGGEGPDPSNAFPIECPNCDPPCAPGEVCQNNQCVTTATCIGICAVDDTPAPAGCYCDEVCFEYEDCCPNICLECPEFAAMEACQGVEPQCGDGVCSPGEDCATCLQDCPCGANESCVNGVCQGGCVPNCDGMQCGADGCGGECGACPPNFNCQEGTCVEGPCEPNCTGKACGDDGCQGSCGECTGGSECINGKCIGCQPNCGGKQCGDNGCGGSCGACPPGKECDMHGNCISGCDPVANCQGKACGDDGCGGVCGQCNPGEQCDHGACVPDCIANCAGKVCGDDGCGGLCGQCGAGQQCDAAGQCQVTCMPNCVGKQCGDDGCGADCGTCGVGEMCNNGACVPECVPQCLNKECGADGCGGFCGVCAGTATCSEAGICVGGEGTVPGADVAGDGGGGGGASSGGSGGCNSTQPVSSSPAIILLGLLLALAVLRRRHSSM